MKIKQDSKYFSGPSGVYYLPSMDELFILNRTHDYKTFSRRDNTMRLYPMYELTSKKMDNIITAVENWQTLIRIGDF